MKIHCDNCKAGYNIPDQKVQGRSFKFKCKRCGHIITVRKASASTSVAIDSAETPAAKAAAPASQAEPAQAKVDQPEQGGTQVWSAAKVQEVMDDAKVEKSQQEQADKPEQGGTQVWNAAKVQEAMDDAKAEKDQQEQADQPEQGGTQVWSAAKVQEVMDDAKAEKVQQTQKEQPEQGGTQVWSAAKVQEVMDDAKAEKVAAPKDEKPIWYVAFENQRFGPITISEIGEKVLGVRPQGEIFVWRSGMENWAKIETVSEFSSVWEQLHEKVVEKDPEPEAPVDPIVERREQLKEEAGKKKLDADVHTSFAELIRDSDEEEESERSFASLLEEEESTGEAQASSDSIAPTLKDLVEKEVGGDRTHTLSETTGVKTGFKVSREEVYEQEWKPEETRRRNLMPMMMFAWLFFLITGAAALAFYGVIPTPPWFQRLPVIGEWFHVEEVDRYGEMQSEFERLVMIDDAKIDMQAAEEEPPSEEEMKAATDEKAEKKAKKKKKKKAKKKRSKKTAKSNKNGAVTEFDFDSEEKLPTTGELDLNDTDRVPPLSRKQVSKVLRKNRSTIGKCIKKHGKGAPQGDMVVRFRINRRGSVVTSKVVTREYDDSPLSQCIIDALGRMEFPSSGGSITINYPFSIQ